MTRCYECLQQCLVGLDGGIYKYRFKVKTIHLPVHHKCAHLIGLVEVKE